MIIKHMHHIKMLLVVIVTGIALSCTNDEMTISPETELSGLPAITTVPVMIEDIYKVTMGGIIEDSGNSTIIAYGICWSTTSNPGKDDVAANYRVKDGSVVGEFSYLFTDAIFAPHIIYYVRAFAQNGSGTQYAPQVTFIIQP